MLQHCLYPAGFGLCDTASPIYIDVVINHVPLWEMVSLTCVSKSCTVVCDRDDVAFMFVARRSSSASPTACPLRGYGYASTQNDRLIPAQWTCRRQCRAATLHSMGDGVETCVKKSCRIVCDRDDVAFMFVARSVRLDAPIYNRPYQ